MSYEVRTTTNYFDGANFYEFSEHETLDEATAKFNAKCGDAKFYVDIDTSVRSVDVELVEIDPDTYDETVINKFHAE